MPNNAKPKSSKKGKGSTKKVQTRKRPPANKSKKVIVAKARRRGIRNALATARVGDEVQNILHFLNPASAYDFRWPFEGSSSNPTATKTASVVLHSVNQYNHGDGFAGTYTGGANGKGNQLFYLFRNPLRAAVVLTTVSAPATYDLYLPSGTQALILQPSAPTLDIPFSYAAATVGTNAPHGQHLFMGGITSRPEMSFIWLNVGDSILVTTAGVGVPDDYFQVWKVDTPGCVGTQANMVGLPVHINALAIGANLFTATDVGYYGVSCVTNAAAVTWDHSFYLEVAVGDCFSHIAVPNAMAHAPYFQSIRLLASSLLVSNVSSTLNIQGSIYGAVISDSTPFYNHTLSSDLTMKQDHFSGRAAKGLYTWLRPGGDNVFAYRHAMETNPVSGVVSDTTFSLDDGSSYQVALVATTGSGAPPTVFPGLDFLVAFCFVLEFKSDDQWVELEYPTITTSEAQASLEVALRAFTFAENPLHMSDIRAFAQKAGRLLRAHSTRIGGALSVLFPEFATPITTISKLLQS